MISRVFLMRILQQIFCNELDGRCIAGRQIMKLNIAALKNILFYTDLHSCPSQMNGISMLNNKESS